MPTRPHMPSHALLWLIRPQAQHSPWREGTQALNVLICTPGRQSAGLSAFPPIHLQQPHLFKRLAQPPYTPCPAPAYRVSRGYRVSPGSGYSVSPGSGYWVSPGSARHAPSAAAVWCVPPPPPPPPRSLRGTLAPMQQPCAARRASGAWEPSGFTWTNDHHKRPHLNPGCARCGASRSASPASTTGSGRTAKPSAEPTWHTGTTSASPAAIR
jgi:hypothetical protein